MRILHVVPTYFPATRYGGPIYSVHGLCKALAKAGHEVHVYTTCVDGGCDSDVSLGAPVTMDGVTVWYFPSPLLRRLYWSPAMSRHMKATLASFDVIHLHSVFLWPTWAAARLAYRYDVPYVLSPRGMLVKDLIKRKSRWLKSAWIKLIETSNLRRAALIHFTANIEQQDFEQCGFAAVRSCVVPNGVDLGETIARGDVSADIRSAIAAGPYILFLGRLNWKKGIDRLLGALPAIPGQRLVLAGNDEEDYVQTIAELLRKHEVGDQVTIVPRFVEEADKQALFQAAMLFVLPSYSENFGNTVPEAMAAGCPVLVTPEVGAAELVRAARCGCVTNGEDLGKAMKELLADGKCLEMMGQAGRAWVERNLTWESVGSTMQEQYLAVLSRREISEAN